MNNTTIPKHLYWACRRGMLELDVLLGNFLAEAYSNLTNHEKIEFEAFLANNDQDLFGWLTGQIVAPEANCREIVNKIREHARNRH